MKKWSSAEVIITALAHLLERCLSLLTFFLGQGYCRPCLFKLRNFLSNICVNMSVENWLVRLPCVLHCLNSFCYSTQPSQYSPSDSTSPFRVRKHVRQGTWDWVAMTEQGLGDSQHQLEKRFLREPEISINQNAQDMVYSRIRPFKKCQGPQSSPN